MCGIFGWQWKKHKRPTMEQRSIVAAALASLNDSRGGDSWGFYAPDKNVIGKSMGESECHGRSLAQFDSIIGHTRKATVGAKTEANSHPFVIGKIIGAHNGSVFNHVELNEKHGRNHDVDSMHIFSGLELGTDLEGIRGSGSIEWINSDIPGQINIVRTSQQADLAVVETYNGVVWSSSMAHLTAALRMAGLIGKERSAAETKAEHVVVLINGEMHTTDELMKFDTYVAQQNQVYGSMYGYGGNVVSPRLTPPSANGQLFSLSKNERSAVKKTIGKSVLLKELGSTWLCEQCCREVNAQRECPRGHKGGVVELKAPGPGATIVVR